MLISFCLHNVKIQRRDAVWPVRWNELLGILSFNSTVTFSQDTHNGKHEHCPSICSSIRYETLPEYFLVLNYCEIIQQI
jgi:hypothetical protein